MSVGALSLVMHVWWGTSRYLSLRSTLTSLLIMGKMKITPGPLAPISLPSLKTTWRSYSLTILIVAPIRPITMMATMA